jgi:hypothetical protein
MSDADYRELLVSPFDQPQQRSWWPLIVGMMVGVIAVGLIFVVGDDESEADGLQAATSDFTTPSATVAVPVDLVVTEDSSPFPSDYFAISATEAVKPHNAVVVGDQIVVSMTTAYARGLDREVEPLFVGGSWALDMSSGETFKSENIVFGVDVLGVFSVIFDVPFDEANQPKTLRLVGLWDSVTSTESVVLPIDELPSPEAPLSVPFDNYTLRIDDVGVYPDGVEIAWAFAGDTETYGTVWFEVEMRGPDGSMIATAKPWSQPRITFGTPEGVVLEIIPGRVVHNTVEDREAFYDDELGQIQELTLRCTATTAVPTQTDPLSFDLTGIPYTMLGREP